MVKGLPRCHEPLGRLGEPARRRFGSARERRAIDGDDAECHTICHNPMVFRREGRPDVLYYCGLWYHDRLVRKAAGWRIAERVEEKCYLATMPEARLS